MNSKCFQSFVVLETREAPYQSSTFFHVLHHQGWAVSKIYIYIYFRYEKQFGHCGNEKYVYFRCFVRGPASFKVSRYMNVPDFIVT